MEEQNGIWSLHRHDELRVFWSSRDEEAWLNGGLIDVISPKSHSHNEGQAGEERSSGNFLFPTDTAEEKPPSCRLPISRQRHFLKFEIQFFQTVNLC